MGRKANRMMINLSGVLFYIVNKSNSQDVYVCDANLAGDIMCKTDNERYKEVKRNWRKL